jgi:hypothetical protein
MEVSCCGRGSFGSCSVEEAALPEKGRTKARVKPDKGPQKRSLYPSNDKNSSHRFNRVINTSTIANVVGFLSFEPIQTRRRLK